MRVLSDRELRALLDQVSECPGIVRGILEAHRSAGGDAHMFSATRFGTGWPESFRTFFEEIFGAHR